MADRVKGDVVKQLIPLVDSFESAASQLKPSSEVEEKMTNAYQVRK